MKDEKHKFNEWFAELPLGNQMKFVVALISGIVGIALGFFTATITPHDFPLDPTVCIVTGVIGLVLLGKAGYFD